MHTEFIQKLINKEFIPEEDFETFLEKDALTIPVLNNFYWRYISESVQLQELLELREAQFREDAFDRKYAVILAILECYISFFSVTKVSFDFEKFYK